MIANFLLILLLAATNAFCNDGAAATPAAEACSDVTKLTVANLTIKMNERTFAFRRGVAYNFDGPDSPSHKPDWEASIELDKTTNATRGVVVRFLLILDNHVTGTGSWYYLVGLRCRPSSRALTAQLQRVFEAHAMSLRVEQLDEEGIVLTTHAFPGKHSVKHISYKWDKRTERYVRERAWITTHPAGSSTPSRP